MRRQRFHGSPIGFVWPAAPALELLLLFLSPIAFLAFYVVERGAPVSGASAHLAITGLIASALILTRSAFVTAGWYGITARLVFSIISSSYIFTLTLYYGLAFVGLNAWNRVPSWHLIKAYIPEAHTLLDSMGLGLSATVGTLLAIYLLILGLFWIALRPAYRTQKTPYRIRPGFLLTLIVGWSLIAGVSAHQFTQGYWLHYSEPLSLSTFPSRWSIQTHSLDESHVSRLDVQDAHVRASYTPTSLHSPPNVVLIVVDALRPSNMGIFGYDRDTTPHLNQLDSLGILSKTEHMHATCAESSCGLLSLGASRFLQNTGRKPITIQEALRSHGYGIHLILSGDHTNFYGLREIYGDIDSYHDGFLNRRFHMNDDRLVIDQLRQFSEWNGAPGFFQIHLMSAHSLGTRFIDTPFQPTINYGRPDQSFLGESAERRQGIVNFYDNGVLQTDLVIKRILGELGDKGYLRRALVIITGDHGEALGEHGILAHSDGVREPVLRIPFIMARFGYNARQLQFADRYVSQVDIAPTILAELGVSSPGNWDGVPLQHQATDRAFYFFQQNAEFGLIDARMARRTLKYWKNFRTGDEHVYDISIDPEEENNLRDEISPELITEWRTQIERNRRLVGVGK